MITNLVVIAAQVVSGVVTNAPMLLPYNPALTIPPIPFARGQAPTEMWEVVRIEKHEIVRFEYGGRKNEVHIITPITNIVTHLKQEWIKK